MGDVLAIVLLIAVVGAVVVMLLYFLMNRGRRRSIASRPIATLGVHEEEAIAARAGEYFRISQRAVRLLDTLLRSPAVADAMSRADRKAAQAIVDEFYG